MLQSCLVPSYQNDKDCLEKAQRLATGMNRGQRRKSCGRRLTDFGLFSLERQRTPRDLMETFSIIRGISGIRPEAPPRRSRLQNQEEWKESGEARGPALPFRFLPCRPFNYWALTYELHSLLPNRCENLHPLEGALPRFAKSCAKGIENSFMVEHKDRTISLST